MILSLVGPLSLRWPPSATVLQALIGGDIVGRRCGDVAKLGWAARATLRREPRLWLALTEMLPSSLLIAALHDREV